VSCTSRTDHHPPQVRPQRRRGLRVTAACAGALLVLPLSAWGAGPALAAGNTLYVGSSGCSAAGPGTQASPFCTISAAVKAAGAGDTVHVASGLYREQVTIPATATGLTLDADPSATVTGADSLGAAVWTATAGSAWSTPLTPASVPAQVFAGGNRLSKAPGADQTTSGSWFYDAASKTLYVDLGGASPAAGDRLEVSTRTYGVLVRGTSNATVAGLTVVRANSADVQLDTATSGSTVRGVTARESASYGIADTGGQNDTVTGVTAGDNVSNGVLMKATTGSTVTGSTSSSNGFHGISVQGGSGATVRGNRTTGNVRPGSRVAAGIDVSSSSTNATVEDNTSYGNDDSGIEIYTGSTGATVRRNVSYDNGDHGVDVSAAAGATVVSNTVVGNSASGLNVEGGSTGTTLRDNIAVNDAVATTRSKGDIRVDGASTSGTTIDHDLVFESDGSTVPYEWAGTTYGSIEALRGATGQEAHGVQADPQFASLGGRNLALTAASPAIDAADTGVAGWRDADIAGHDPVDDPQVTDTGAGPTTFADLGAFELTDVPPPAVDAPPTAALGASPSQVTQGGTVTLDASGSTDDHGVTGYVFDCGNGTVLPSQTTATATCTYPGTGTFTATVTVSDSAGQTDTASQAVTVGAASVLTAALTVTPSPVPAGQPATLDASASTPGTGATITGYRFSCSAGVFAAKQASPTSQCTYAKAGQYNAAVIVIDSLGHRAKTTKPVTVSTTTATKPTARLTLTPTSAKRGQAVVADASASTTSSGARVSAYRFQCGSQTGTAWSTTSSHTCKFWTAVGSTPRVTVWVRDAAGLVGTTSRTVRIVS